MAHERTSVLSLLVYLPVVALSAVVINCSSGAPPSHTSSVPPPGGSTSVGGGTSVGPHHSGGGPSLDTDSGAGAQPGCDGPCPDTVDAGPTCGNGVVDQATEQCDDGNRAPRDGCTGGCKTEPYAVCPATGGPCTVPICGNGVREGVEQCDDGNQTAGDGCSLKCRIEATYWDCPPTGGACVSKVTCGDGKVEGGEVCDDGNKNDGDGCAGNCMSVDVGWICRKPGIACTPQCGDGKILAGVEECDDGNKNDKDGCSRTCMKEVGFNCTGEPSSCVATLCGDGKMEGTEMCDLGEKNGLFYGDGTGCSNACTPEPLCRDPAGGPTHECTSYCGDGMRLGDEECDDGNRLSHDGCSDQCKIEAGNSCTPVIQDDTKPCTESSGQCLIVPIIARDFKGQNEGGGNTDFFYYGANGIGGEKTCCVPNASCNPDDTTVDCPDYAKDITPMCTGLVQTELDPFGKPQASTKLTCDCQFTDWDDTGILKSCAGASLGGGADGHDVIEGPVQMIESAASFAKWYAKDHPEDATVRTTLELTRNGSVYVFESSDGRTVIDDIHDGVPITAGFFPVDDLTSSEKMCNLWGYWQDWPGCEGSQWDPLANQGNGERVEATGTEHNFYFTTEARYIFVYQGGEKLSFFGDDDVWVFVNGILAVDLGGTHMQLDGSVTLSNQGDPVEDRNFNLKANNAYEIAVFHADRHPRDSNYKLTMGGFKTERSQCGPTCGDGVKTLMEECDDGTNNNDTAYGGCKTDCTFGPFCGDGIVNGDEVCDDGTNTTTDYGAQLPQCAPGCVAPPRCGDGNIDEVEECDDGDGNNVDGTNGGCSSTCMLNPKCGDYIVNEAAGEECDYGDENEPPDSVSYGGCTTECKLGPRCGDGHVDDFPLEMCDDGNLNPGDGCNQSCMEEITI
jgi:fibro-slime domain-containing protein